MGLKPTQRGALVIEVMPGSPAQQVGLRGSDRDTVLDGEPVRLGGDVVIAIDSRAVKRLMIFWPTSHVPRRSGKQWHSLFCARTRKTLSR